MRTISAQKFSANVAQWSQAIILVCPSVDENKISFHINLLYFIALWLLKKN